MQHDDLEFLISQYVDGTLEEADRAGVEARLRADAGARAMLEEHRAVVAWVRSAPLPEVRWDRLAETISSAIDQEMQARADRASWAMRLVRRPAWVAAAASVLIAAGISLHFMLGTGQGPSRTTPAVHPIRHEMLVEVSQPDRPAGPVVSRISIGAGGAYASESSLAPYADEIDTRPARVVIASDAPVQSQAGLPF